jgi:hypothetical protein
MVQTRRANMKQLLALLALIAATGVAAQDPGHHLFLKELSKCDRNFFERLGDSKGELEKLAPMRSLGRSASFQVPSPEHRTNSRVMFANPPVVEGLKFVGYFDEVLDLPNGMTSYSWGYLIASTVQEAATRLHGLVWDPMRLRKDGPVFVRSEVWSHERPEAGWTRSTTEAGVPRRGTVERVLLIEPYDGERAFIRFGCSIQGNITDPVLRAIRSDLRE